MRNKYFNSVMRDLSIESNTFIYKNNLELLRLYYNSLTNWEKYGINKVSSWFWIKLFKDVLDITPSKIETNYSTFILKELSNTLVFSKKHIGYGLYFIYDEYDEIIYIGKSKNIEVRSVQSFINKYPFGAKYIKIVLVDEDDDLDTFESILINFYMPLFNNTTENVVNIFHRSYTKIVNYFSKKLNEEDILYPYSTKLQEYIFIEKREQVEMNIFDNIDV